MLGMYRINALVGIPRPDENNQAAYWNQEADQWKATVKAPMLHMGGGKCP